MTDVAEMSECAEPQCGRLTTGVACTAHWKALPLELRRMIRDGRNLPVLMLRAEAVWAGVT